MLSVKRRVLLVDDDARTVRLLARLLTEDGFEVEVSTDGAHALARLSAGAAPDVLITDLRMPHVDGLEVARHARSLNPSIPVFIVTGYPEMISRIEDVLPPIAHVFPKPLAYPELTAAMRSAGEHHGSNS